MLCRAIQDRWVMVESSDNHFSVLVLRTHEQYEKAEDGTLKDELSRLVGAQYATGDQWINKSRKDEGTEPKQKQYPVVDVTGDRSEVWCCKSNIA